MPHDHQLNKLVHLLAVNDQIVSASTELVSESPNHIVREAARQALQAALKIKIIAESAIATLSESDQSGPE
jgi:hypothetical protein